MKADKWGERQGVWGDLVRNVCVVVDDTGQIQLESAAAEPPRASEQDERKTFASITQIVLQQKAKTGKNGETSSHALEQTEQGPSFSWGNS